MRSNDSAVASRLAYALWASAKRGGARRDRTADLIIANDALSQLSYGPVTAALSRDIEKVRAADKRTAIYSPSLCRVKNSEKCGGRSFGPELPLFEPRGTDI